MVERNERNILCRNVRTPTSGTYFDGAHSSVRTLSLFRPKLELTMLRATAEPVAASDGKLGRMDRRGGVTVSGRRRLEAIHE